MNAPKQMRSGAIVDLAAFKASDVNEHDIAWHLAHINRFGGAGTHYYSVAEHCYLGSMRLSGEKALKFLLHDASEAYLGDITAPVKRMVKECFEPIERAVEDAIYLHFGVEPGHDADVKEVDLRMLETERHQLGLSGNDDYWPEAFGYPGMKLLLWDAQTAYDYYLLQLNELRKEVAA